MSEIYALNTTTDTKKHLGIHQTKLYQLIASGKLDARKIGGGTRITGESIISFIASLPAASIGQRHTDNVG